MNTKTNTIFDVFSLDVLANITGEKLKDYCTGQVFGKIFTKKALGQIIVPTDYICR